MEKATMTTTVNPKAIYSGGRCAIHDVSGCVYCANGGQLPDDGESPSWNMRPLRTWGGQGTVAVLGRDDKPVQIPAPMQYVWHTTSYPDTNHVAMMATLAYRWVRKSAERQKLPLPPHDVREDIAQTGLENFLRNAKESDNFTVAIQSRRDLCFEVSKALRAHYRPLQSGPSIIGLDEITNLPMGPVERWAGPGTYLPLMGLLKEAKAAVDSGAYTPYQHRLVDAWAILDPEFKGYISRNTKENPLTEAESKRLQRIRQLDIEEETTMEIDYDAPLDGWLVEE